MPAAWSQSRQHVCGPRRPAKMRLKIQDRGGGDSRDDWEKYRKLAEATEVMQAQEREERGAGERRREKLCPGT